MDEALSITLLIICILLLATHFIDIKNSHRDG